MAELETTPQEDLKPHLVWLGKFLGMDVYLDIQGSSGDNRRISFARRLFERIIADQN